MKMKYGFIIFLALILCQNLVAGEFEFEWHKLPVMPAGLKTIIIRTGDNLLAEKAEYQNGRIIKSYLTFDNGKMWILATSYEYENDLLVYETDYLGGKVKALRINTYDKNKRLTETKQYSVRNDIETLADIISCEYNQKGHMIHRIKKDTRGNIAAEETFEYNAQEYVEKYHYKDYVEKYDYGMRYQYTYDKAGRIIKETITAADNPKDIWNVFLLEYHF